MKRLFLVLGGIVLLLAGLLVAAPFLIDPNDFKEQMAKAVQEHTGREVRIEGRVEATLFPNVGISMAHLTLGNASGFGTEPMAKLESAVVSVKLMPLLGGAIEVDQLTLRGIVLNLARNAKGQGNWEDLTAARGAPPVAAGPTAPAQPLAVRLSGVTVQQATIHWQDGVSGVSQAVENLSLTSGPLAPGQPLALSLKGDLRQTPQTAPLHVELEAKAQWPQGGQRLTLDSLQLLATQTGKSPTELTVKVMASCKGEMDLAQLQTKVSGLKVSMEAALAKRQTVFNLESAGFTGDFSAGLIKAEPVQASLAVQGEGEKWDVRLAAAPEVDLTRKSAKLTGIKASVTGGGGALLPKRQLNLTFDAPVLLADLEKSLLRVDPLKALAVLSGEGLPGGKAEVHLNTVLEAGLDGHSVTLRNLTLTGPDQLSLAGEVQGRELTRQYDLQTRLSEVKIKPRALLTLLGQTVPTTRDGAALGQFEGQGITLHARPDAIKLALGKARLDDTRFSGDLALQGATRSTIQFNMMLDSLDLDRYLPVAPAAAPAQGQPGAKDKGGDKPLPVEPLRTLTLDGELKANRLILGGARFEAMQGKVRIKNGVLEIDPLRARFYEGVIDTNVRLDAATATPALSAKAALTGVQMGPFLKEVFDYHSLAGTGELQAQITSSGATNKAMVANLAGNLNYAFTKGSIKGFNLLNQIRSAYLLATGQLPKNPEGGDSTEFSELKGTAVIQNGRITTNDLAAISPVLNVKGQGYVDLPQEQIDFLVKANALTLFKEYGSKTDQSKLEIPVRIHGPFGNLQKEVDTKELLKSQAGAKVQEKLDKVLDQKLVPKLEEKLGKERADKVGGLLKGLTGGKSQPAAPAPQQPAQAAPAPPQQPAPAPAQEKPAQRLLKGLLK